MDQPPIYNSGYSQRIQREIRLISDFTGINTFAMVFVSPRELFSAKGLKKRLNNIPCSKVSSRHLLSSHLKINRKVYDYIYARILYKWVKKHKIDVLVCENLWCAYIGGQLLKWLNVKVVFDYHGVVPEESVYDNLCKIGDKNYNYLKLIEKKALNESHSIICVSNRFKRYLIDSFGIDQNRISVVPCCVNDIPQNINMAIREKIRRELSINSKKVIIYAGSIVKYQCVNEMIRIFSKLRQYDNDFFFLFLSAYNNYGSIKQLFNNVGVSDEYYKLLSVKQSEVYDYLCAADFGMLIRDNDLLNKVSCPTKMAEYLMAGLPIIATSSVGDIKDVKSNVILCEFEDITEEDFIKQICNYDISVATRKNNFNTAYNYLFNNFTWESYKDVYRNLIF